jgi:hypothetical protein
MLIQFVDREAELRDIENAIFTNRLRPRVLALSAPAGMGKTHLLIELCRKLVANADWRIVRLDFREPFPCSLDDRVEVLREIARQLCRNVETAQIADLIASANSQSRLLLRQAARIPLSDDILGALLRMAANAPVEDLIRAAPLFVSAFRDAPVATAMLRSTNDLVRFMFDSKDVIGGPVLVILDGADAIQDDAMRTWVINDLAVRVGTDFGLHQVFQDLSVIVAGRFIDRDLDRTLKPQFFQLFDDLESFSGRSYLVADLVQQFNDPVFNQSPDRVRQLGRKLTQMCGGHPAIIKETAAELRAAPHGFAILNMNPLLPVHWTEQKDIKNTLGRRRAQAVDEILRGVRPEQKELLKRLSIYRKFNSATAEFVAKKLQTLGSGYAGPMHHDVRELYHGLSATRLVVSDGAEDLFDSACFSLNLLAAEMQDQEPETFVLFHNWAAELFENWTRRINLGGPYQWDCICEWLYHRLHLVQHWVWTHRHSPDASEVRAARVDSLLSDFCRILKSLTIDPEVADPERFVRPIEARVGKDEQIDHLIWEIALEDERVHDRILRQLTSAILATAEQARPCP